MVQRLARGPFKAEIRVRFPLALPILDMDRLRIIHGFSGIVVGFLPFPVLWLLAYVCLPKATNFNLDPLGQPGTFDSFLAKYLRLGEFVVGIAASSIVLLVGSSTLRTASVGIPRFYSSLLFLASIPRHFSSCVGAFYGGFSSWLGCCITMRIISTVRNTLR
jgi:hypothetical protein